jgi:hypothetical protein
MEPVVTPGRSGLLRAGEILLLVGAFLQLAYAVLMLGFGVMVGWVRDAQAAGSVTPFPSWFVPLYFVLGALGLAGCVLTFLAYRAVGRGEPRHAFMLGLAGSLLPPVQVVPLLGAILCKVSPESGQAVRQGRPGPGGARRTAADADAGR